MINLKSATRGLFALLALIGHACGVPSFYGKFSFWPSRGMPPQAAALIAPPPIPQGRCEVAIYPEASFAGTVVATSEEQPRLSESGWQNQIASIQVRAGTWDFYTEENFGGNAMRLPPGPYPTLAPEWTKHIGSFMCSQPGG